jgi:LCP family protein required for cell wall assembly
MSGEGSGRSEDGHRPVRRSSRARAEGSARPVAGDGHASTPPSFAPAGRGRPSPGAGDPIVVGQGASRRPSAPAQRTSAPPTVTPRSADEARPAARAVPPTPAPAPSARPDRPRRRRRRAGRTALLMVLALLLAWPLGLALWADSRIQHVEATSGAPATPGVTYLLAGSDSRADGYLEDTETEGARTDTIMLLHAPTRGPAALISLPRDSYVDIPGHNPNKLNAAYSWGGAPLLVATVEELTGLTVDHYVEVGFGGVSGIVDAVGGVELCLDYAVDEPLSGLVWPEAGCRESDGETALAFARMRYADPYGDIGRAQRQQQLISALTGAVADPVTLVDPRRQVDLVRAGTDALVTSEETSVVDLGRLALTFRRATGPEGVTGTPWITSLDHRPGGVGSAVLLDAERNAGLWRDLRQGDLSPGTVGGPPTG